VPYLLSWVLPGPYTYCITTPGVVALGGLVPVGSAVASRFVFRLCLLLPLVNGHVRLLLMRCAAVRYTIQLRLIHGHVLYGTPAFIQQALRVKVYRSL
jgi:hypothetical protein